MKITARLKNILIEDCKRLHKAIKDPAKQCVLGVILQVFLILVIIKHIVPLMPRGDIMENLPAAMSEESIFHLTACFCFGVVTSIVNVLTYNRKILDTIALFICWVIFARSFPDLAYECICWVLPMTYVLVLLRMSKHIVLTRLGVEVDEAGNKYAG